jgi:hypothetical protein
MRVRARCDTIDVAATVLAVRPRDTERVSFRCNLSLSHPLPTSFNVPAAAGKSSRNTTVTIIGGGTSSDTTGAVSTLQPNRGAEDRQQ